MAELVKVTVNGQELQVEKGARLIDVCRENGYAIPSFCYYADLALQASCRMCLVRIEKMPKLQTSCTITCTDGMVVTTQSEEIEKAQRGMVEFLLANHPLDCPVCDRGGECELQEMVFDWGNLEERFTERKNYAPEKYLSPIVANDPQRCILCKRCTRVCDEWMGEDAIEAGGRGAHTVIGTYGGWLNCSQCGNCIEVCPTGTLLDATYRHQTRPWELSRTTSTCTFCSDGCQLSVGSRGGEVMRVVARDRYVNGHNGEFLCIKGRFAHPFVNHEERLRTPLIRYKKGGKLIPATWDEAIRFAAEKLSEIKNAHGPASIGVVGSPRLTNESNWALLRFAREAVGTDKYTATEAFSLAPFFENLGAPLATHRDIRHAKTIVLIGGEPEELQPLTGRQIRQAVRNGGAKLVIINSVPIRLKQQAAHFVHIRPGTEDAAVLALVSPGDVDDAARRMGVEADELNRASQFIGEAAGDVVVLFGGELSGEAQAVLARLSSAFGEKEGRRFLLHPLPLFNNSVGVHDLGLMSGAVNPLEILDAAGSDVKAMYVAGSFLPAHLEGRGEALSRLDFLVVQELFQTETTRHADVVFPAASFAEVDGTFTNNGGLVQRVRQSINPVHQSKPDWAITSQLASALGVELGFQMSSSTIFLDIARRVPAYQGLRYPQLKDESRPVQVKHQLATGGDFSSSLGELRGAVTGLPTEGEKLTGTPPVGHELFRIGTLTGKVPQFHLLAAGNPEPENVLISPLYQITIDSSLRRETAAAGD
ncbi:MAG TPA: NADH-quinone oxidoreductase subunit NuoG [Pyrinomonadaceae bacterium]|jgi:NADH-quinone oxidoreductase subunit G|nr:NADH-quinone oxidoreductase subunit NuoG [Pyrinomonadaceae bacterium]